MAPPAIEIMPLLTVLVCSTGLRIINAASVVVYCASPSTPSVSISRGTTGASWLCLGRSGGLSRDTTSTVLLPQHLEWPPIIGSPVDPVNGVPVAEWFSTVYGEQQSDYLAWSSVRAWGSEVVIADPTVALEAVAYRRADDSCSLPCTHPVPEVCAVMPLWPCPPKRIRWAGVGDINIDGTVNATDLMGYMLNPYDYNGSGAVDVQDYKDVQDAVNLSRTVDIYTDPTWRRYLADQAQETP